MNAGSLWSKFRTTIHICCHFPFHSQKPYIFFKLYTYTHINTYIHTYIHPTTFLCRVRHRPHSQGHKTCEKSPCCGSLSTVGPLPCVPLSLAVGPSLYPSSRSSGTESSTNAADRRCRNRVLQFSRVERECRDLCCYPDIVKITLMIMHHDTEGFPNLE